VCLKNKHSIATIARHLVELEDATGQLTDFDNLPNIYLLTGCVTYECEPLKMESEYETRLLQQVLQILRNNP